MWSAPACKMFITPENSLLPPYKLLINGKLVWCGTKGRGREGSVGPLAELQDPPATGGMCDPAEKGTAPLWVYLSWNCQSPLGSNAYRIYPEDTDKKVLWWLAAGRKWEMLPDSELEGTGWLWEMFFSIAGWGWEGQTLPYPWCHKSPGAGAESHTHLHPPNVNNPQDSEIWMIKITNIFQYNCDEHVLFSHLPFKDAFDPAWFTPFCLDWLLVGSLAAVPLFSVFSRCCRIWNRRFVCVREFLTWLSSQRSLQWAIDGICPVVTEEPVSPCPTSQTQRELWGYFNVQLNLN